MLNKLVACINAVLWPRPEPISFFYCAFDDLATKGPKGRVKLKDATFDWRYHEGSLILAMSEATFLEAFNKIPRAITDMHDAYWREYGDPHA